MKRFLIAALLGAVPLSACGGGGTSSAPLAPPTLAPSAQPSPTPAPANPQASVASIAFNTNAATTFTVTESGYNGTFRESDTCNPLTGEIAAVSAVASATAGSASYSVAPTGAGSCQITISDGAGQSVPIPVTVSAAVITVQ